MFWWAAAAVVVVVAVAVVVVLVAVVVVVVVVGERHKMARHHTSNGWLAVTMRTVLASKGIGRLGEREQLLQQRRVHRPRAEGVHADALAGELHA